MSRKSNKAAVQKTAQFKHLRFVNPLAVEEGDKQNSVLNNGGFTLAFRIFEISRLPAEQQVEWADSQAQFILSYGWSECCLNDNFDAAKGRAVAFARLQHMAPSWTHTFALELDGHVDGDKIINRSAEVGDVDLIGLESAVASALILNFINEQQAFLYAGSDLEQFNEYLIEYKGALALNSEVLLTNLEDEDDVTTETLILAEESLELIGKMGNIANELNAADPNNALHSELQCLVMQLRANIDTIHEMNGGESETEPSELEGVQAEVEDAGVDEESEDTVGNENAE